MQSPSLLRLAFKRLWRDARAGELRLLLIGVCLAVAAVTAVSLLVNRLEQGLLRDAAQLIGGDLVLTSDQPAPAWVREQALAQGFEASESASFPSMARADDAQGGASRLVAVKAVAPNYPLRGRVRLEGGRLAGAPPAGEVWVDRAVLDALQLRLGDSLWLGEARLKLGAVIETEPDRGAGFLAFAPRVLLAQADLAATELVQPASRVGYRLALVAAPQQSKALAQWRELLNARINKGEWRGARIETLEGGRPELRQTLERGTRFLSLVALLASLLAAVGVALAARDFANRHVDECALLRVLGLSSARIAGSYAIELLVVGVAATLLGGLLGLGVQALLLVLLQGLVPVELPAPGLQPFALAGGLGLSLLLAFGLPPVLRLAQISPLRVLRRELGAKLNPLAALVGVAGLAAWMAVLALAAGDATLGGLTIGGFVLAAALLALLAGLALLLLRRVAVGPAAPPWLRLATRQVAARPALAVAQVAALGLGLLALALLVLLRTDLLESWRLATPAKGPDRFVVNLQPDQAEPFKAQLAAAGVQPLDWYPMFRGRLIAINGQAVHELKLGSDRARRLVEREFNLSHMSTMPAHNQALEGSWGEGLSVEDGLMKELGLKLGDRLAFEVAGQRHELAVLQRRQVDWSSMRVNFFVIFQRSQSPQASQQLELPSTWIATYRAPADKTLDRQLAARFPNATLIDVSAQISQVQGVLEQVANAVQLLFLFTLAAGLVVLVGALTATREARLRDVALMRALGASGALLARVQRAELLGLGLLSGVLAGGLALGIGALLAVQVFEFSWRPQPWVPLGTALAGALLAGAAGYWGLRGVLRRPVVQTLRAATQE
ncbi:ABC transporter permease [Inhella sp.]|uniref:ABC transporter permease n=1 Tax=Inhella sp. TaxID=1921806 RepID=UPI0035AE5997